MPERGSTPSSPTFQAGSFNHCTRAPDIYLQMTRWVVKYMYRDTVPRGLWPPPPSGSRTRRPPPPPPRRTRPRPATSSQTKPRKNTRPGPRSRVPITDLTARCGRGLHAMTDSCAPDIQYRKNSSTI